MTSKKRVSLDPTRLCNYTSNKTIKIQVRIHSTFKVIRACMFIVWSVLEVTQRVPPTCVVNTDCTYRCRRPWCLSNARGRLAWHPPLGTGSGILRRRCVGPATSGRRRRVAVRTWRLPDRKWTRFADVKRGLKS